MNTARSRAEGVGVDVDGLHDVVERRQGELSKVATGAASKFSEGRGGQTYREGSEAVAQRLGSLPVVTVGRDVVQARYDLTGHVERLRADPRSLDQLIWTATALRQVDVGLGRYRKVRAISAGARLIAGSPVSAMVQATAGLTSRLHADDEPPPLELLLRCAFTLAIARLRSDPVDWAAHYAMARIYLLTDHVGPAVTSARAAVRTARDDLARGDALTALAFAELGRGHREEAARVASMAVDAGVSTGHLVKATLLETANGDFSRDRASKAAEHRRLVTQEDRTRYFGSRPTTEAVARLVWDQQKRKSRTSVEGFHGTLANALEGLRGRNGDDDAG